MKHGPLARYAKLRVAHAPGMPGMFSPSPRVSDPSMHHGTCVTHVPWCMPGSLANGVLWSRWRGKRSRQSRRMRDLQIYVSGKRSMCDEIISGYIVPTLFLLYPHVTMSSDIWAHQLLLLEPLDTYYPANTQRNKHVIITCLLRFVFASILVICLWLVALM